MALLESISLVRDTGEEAHTYNNQRGVTRVSPLPQIRVSLSLLLLYISPASEEATCSPASSHRQISCVCVCPSDVCARWNLAGGSRSKQNSLTHTHTTTSHAPRIPHAEIDSYIKNKLSMTVSHHISKLYFILPFVYNLIKKYFCCFLHQL